MSEKKREITTDRDFIRGVETSSRIEIPTLTKEGLESLAKGLKKVERGKYIKITYPDHVDPAFLADKLGELFFGFKEGHRDYYVLHKRDIYNIRFLPDRTSSAPRIRVTAGERESKIEIQKGTLEKYIISQLKNNLEKKR